MCACKRRFRRAGMTWCESTLPEGAWRLCRVRVLHGTTALRAELGSLEVTMLNTVLLWHGAPVLMDAAFFLQELLRSVEADLGHLTRNPASMILAKMSGWGRRRQA